MPVVPVCLCCLVFNQVLGLPPESRALENGRGIGPTLDTNTIPGGSLRTQAFVLTPLPWPWPRNYGSQGTLSPTGRPQNVTTPLSVTRHTINIKKTSLPTMSIRETIRSHGNRTTVSSSSPPEGNRSTESPPTGSANRHWTVNTVGCFRDSYVLPRPLPELIADFRDIVGLYDANKTIDACAERARERGFKAFGIQFYTECWSGTGAENTYGRDGTSKDCENGVGKSGANFVYKFADFGFPSCPTCSKPRRLCFPAISRVMLESGVSVTMRQLRIGDRVRTLGTNGKPLYSDILGFLHKEVDTVAQFYTLELDGGQVIRLSAQHLIFTKRKFPKTFFKAIFASEVKLDDFLYISDKNISGYKAVVRISKVTERGVFAPLTAEGTLLVDGVFVSCYAHWDSQEAAHLAMAPLRAFYSVYRTTQHFANMLGFSSWNFIETNDGISWYALVLLTFANLL